LQHELAFSLTLHSNPKKALTDCQKSRMVPGTDTLTCERVDGPLSNVNRQSQEIFAKATHSTYLQGELE
jgi:hypothetical protein